MTWFLCSSRYFHTFRERIGKVSSCSWQAKLHLRARNWVSSLFQYSALSSQSSPSRNVNSELSSSRWLIRLVVFDNIHLANEVTKFSEAKCAFDCVTSSSSIANFFVGWVFGQLVTSFLFPDCKQITTVDHVIGIQLKLRRTCSCGENAVVEEFLCWMISINLTPLKLESIPNADYFKLLART